LKDNDNDINPKVSINTNLFMGSEEDNKPQQGSNNIDYNENKILSNNNNNNNNFNGVDNNNVNDSGFNLITSNQINNTDDVFTTKEKVVMVNDFDGHSIRTEKTSIRGEINNEKPEVNENVYQKNEIKENTQKTNNNLNFNPPPNKNNFPNMNRNVFKTNINTNTNAIINKNNNVQVIENNNTNINTNINPIRNSATTPRGAINQ
jgi:hypothetical protein